MCFNYLWKFKFTLLRLPSIFLDSNTFLICTWRINFSDINSSTLFCSSSHQCSFKIQRNTDWIMIRDTITFSSFWCTKLWHWVTLKCNYVWAGRLILWMALWTLPGGQKSKWLAFSVVKVLPKSCLFIKCYPCETATCGGWLHTMTEKTQESLYISVKRTYNHNE